MAETNIEYFICLSATKVWLSRFMFATFGETVGHEKQFLHKIIRFWQEKRFLWLNRYFRLCSTPYRLSYIACLLIWCEWPTLWKFQRLCTRLVFLINFQGVRKQVGAQTSFHKKWLGEKGKAKTLFWPKYILKPREGFL